MKRNIVIATVAAAALIGGGTVAAYAAAGDDDGAATQRQSSVRISDDRDDSADDSAEDRADDRDDKSDDNRDDDSVEVRSDAAGTKVTAADAIAAALKHTPGTAVGADLDDDGSRAWEVSVVKGDGTEHDVRVSANDGKVLGAHRDDDDDDAREDLTALKGADVDAREAAVAAAAKGTVTDVDLDDDGPAAWSVETTKGEWKVDLGTGKVTQDLDD
ncbi:PepSY domain-containing protein [Streptomyces chartreusis]|uniref:PepSY domain-containing protein n=1 Tax=Streptomyces chartreusis TaxID=1969 RepID=A0A7H8T5C8_STRCX|nr:PepSY domain-containing protein [Streptomyces chartreusis]QKZ18719.1 PepSY domain-containing protein [Streptomyces chartreusis]